MPRTQRAPLVLDNWHLVTECASVASIPPGVPERRILATSREPLGIARRATCGSRLCAATRGRSTFCHEYRRYNSSEHAVIQFD